MTAPAPSNASGDQQHSRLGLALFVICCAQLMVVLDATIVNVALPKIRDALHFSDTGLEWVITAYSLTFGGLLLLGGRLGDLFGRRRMFMVGIGLFAAASFAGGFANSKEFLLIARALQGVGGAIAAPTALALITTTFPEGPARTRAFGLYAAMAGSGAAIGLLLGGVLTDWLSWRYTLFVNFPVGLIVLALAPLALGESERGSGKLDVPGAATITASMALLVYGLSNAGTHPDDPWGRTGTWLSLVLAAVLLVVFVLVEQFSKEPLMPFSIFKNRNRVGANLLILAVGAAIFGVFFFLTLFVQNPFTLHFSPLRSGLAFLPLSGVIIVVSGVMTQVVPRVGLRIPLVVGPAMAAVALFWLSSISVHSSYVDILLPLLLMGVGMGTLFVPLTMAAVTGVQEHESGLASALLNVGQQIGGSIGLAVLATTAASATANRDGAVAKAASQGAQAAQRASIEALVHGWSVAFVVAGCLAAAGVLISLIFIRVRKEDIPSGMPLPG